MDDPQQFAREAGPQLITFLKVIFIFSFIVLSLTDRDITWFKRQPGKTIGEAMLAGFCSAASFTFLGHMRGYQGLVKLFLISFFVFMALQFLFELSGFNELKETADTGAKKFASVVKTFGAKKWIWALVVMVATVVLSFAIVANDAPTMPWSRFALEGFILGLGSAVPSIMVTVDRGGSAKQVVENFGAMMILFGAVAHPFLQYSGVYSEVFS